MDYKAFCTLLARQAGAVIKKNFRGGMKKDWKQNETPVTKTDIAINKLVISRVKKYFPDHGVLGEEESYSVKGREYLWVCDPVDGTIPFSHGVPTCVFSLALVKNGVPLVGVIYDPFMDRLVFAEKGKGAYLNGKKTHVNNHGMDKAVLNWESGRLALPLQRKFKNCMPIRLNSFIYGGLLVASGELVASLYTWMYAHDGASLKVIIEEAGGKTSDLKGNDQLYNGKIFGMLVSNGVVHKQLLEIIRRNPKKYSSQYY
jgi:fructose-1,6-bisphosphatase/inositol monophosphatase family enzyme